MPSLPRVLAFAALLTLPGSSGAAPFTAALRIEMVGLGTLTFVGSGSGTSSGSLVALPAGFVSGTQTLPLGGPALTKARFSVENQAGTFTGGTLQGVMPVTGSFRGLAFGGIQLIPFGGVLPLTEKGTRGFGIGPEGIHRAAGGVNLTLIGAPWTAGTAKFVVPGTPFAGPFAGQTLTRGGSDLRTPGGLGSLELVTPLVLRTNLNTVGYIPAFGKLQLTFVPEPGTLVLCAAGVAALAARGAHRRTRTRSSTASADSSAASASSSSG